MHNETTGLLPYCDFPEKVGGLLSPKRAVPVSLKAREQAASCATSTLELSGAEDGSTGLNSTTVVVKLCWKERTLLLLTCALSPASNE